MSLAPKGTATTCEVDLCCQSDFSFFKVDFWCTVLQFVFKLVSLFCIAFIHKNPLSKMKNDFDNINNTKIHFRKSRITSQVVPKPFGVLY